MIYFSIFMQDRKIKILEEKTALLNKAKGTVFL